MHDGERFVGSLEVRRPRDWQPRGRDIVTLLWVDDPEDDYAADWDDPTETRTLRRGDPNDNGVFGGELEGALVLPGAPDKSYLMRRLVDPSAGPLMPRANCCSWTKEALRAMHCWIAGLSPDGGNALDPIDYANCPEGPREAVAYPEPGPECLTAGMCPVAPSIELGEPATWARAYALLASRCGDASCHGTATHGLDLGTEARARTSLADYVVPGDPARSVLYRRITPDLAQASGFELMPMHTPPLELSERELIRAYISQQTPPEP
jgi:hypothetical protein